MRYLFHLSTVPKYLDWFRHDWDEIQAFAKEHQMDGVEIMVHDYDIDRVPDNFAYGMHLRFWPMWLDFWNRDAAAVANTVGERGQVKRLYGDIDPQCLVDQYRSQYNTAKKLGVKYMVFHVSHVTNEDIFKWEYDYTDKEVMEATIALVNQAFPKDEDGPLLLFENLWWPGLTFCDPELTKWFIEQIDYKNKGYLLDTSHLILTNPEIGTEDEAVDYMRRIVRSLGKTSSYIKGMHVNKALPKEYMRQNHLLKLEKYKNAKTQWDKTGIIKEHIGNLDVHKPFDHPAIGKLIDDIKPEFCVFEVTPDSKEELSHYLTLQNKALGRAD